MDIHNDYPKVLTGKYDNSGQLTSQILTDLKKGDPDAYKAVYNLCHTPLYKLIRKIYPGFDAEEIAQAVMVEVWEKRDRIDPGKNFGAYLFKMAVSYANKLHRRRKVESSYLQFAQENGGESNAPDELFIEKQTRLLMDIILSRMPERRRRIYEMHRNEGLNYDKIAEELKVSRKTVEYNMSMALRDLREILAMFIILVSVFR